MKIPLQTKAKGRAFAYEKTASGDIKLEFGRGKWRAAISSADYLKLINEFKGRTVALGTSRDNPPHGSVGEWLQKNVTKTAVAAYLGPILVREGHAQWVGTTQIEFC